MKVKKVVRGTTSRQVRRYMEGNNEVNLLYFTPVFLRRLLRTTPSRSTGSGLKNSLESKIQSRWFIRQKQS